jgi:hypothetical protein
MGGIYKSQVTFVSVCPSPKWYKCICCTFSSILTQRSVHTNSLATRICTPSGPSATLQLQSRCFGSQPFPWRRTAIPTLFRSVLIVTRELVSVTGGLVVVVVAVVVGENRKDSKRAVSSETNIRYGKSFLLNIESWRQI